jgi:lipoprotein-anchoring transpeptidase ErfK/SrfK
MYRVPASALITSALFALALAPANGAPLDIAPRPQAAQETETAPAAPPVRYAQATRGRMGGGFIEYLFDGNNDAPAGRSNGRSAPDYAPLYPARPQYEEEPGYQPDGPRRESYGRQGYPQYVRGEPGEESAPQRRAVDPKYRKQVVDYDGKEKPGTVVIDTPNRFLYLVQPGGRAMRYGIGVGKPGFAWAGVKSITMKKEWPDWRPPAEMLKRRPDLPHFMAGGPENPLGARALYLGSSLYRIHGSNEPWTIGTAVSSGCIRMRNEDVTDLYERVGVGTRVIVM